MRIRHALAALLLVLAVPIGWSSVASAQEGGTEIDHESEECIEILEDGGEVDECHEAPSLIFPETNEIVWGALSFAILLFLLSKFAFPAMKQGMADRTERIRADVEGAEHAKAEAETVLEEYRAKLADAKAEGSRIIEEARQAADALKVEQERRLQDELAEMRARAMSDIEVAKEQVLADLRGEVASLAIGAAERVVQRNLDNDTQVQLIENYINEVGRPAHGR